MISNPNKRFGWVGFHEEFGNRLLEHNDGFC